LEITVSFLGIHKWEPDFYIGFSLALHLQCEGSEADLYPTFNFNADLDPDPDIDCHADPDPAFYSDADPDLAKQNDAAPDPQHR
jgi:hypothetical protein